MNLHTLGCKCERVATVALRKLTTCKTLRPRLVIAPTIQCLLMQHPSETCSKQERCVCNTKPRSFWRQRSHPHRTAVSCQTCPSHWHPPSSPANILGHYCMPSILHMESVVLSSLSLKASPKAPVMQKIPFAQIPNLAVRENPSS